MSTGALCRRSYLLTQCHAASGARLPGRLTSIDINDKTSSADQMSC